MKMYTSNSIGKNINNNKIKKNGIKTNSKKPHTPEINSMNYRCNKENEIDILNKINNKNNKRPSTAPHNNIHIKK